MGHVLTVEQGVSGQIFEVVQPDGTLSTIARLAAADSVFVYQPGGVAGGNVYTDWPTMIAAVNGNGKGPRWVWIDPSFTGATVPAGTWDLDDVILGSVQPVGAQPSTLTLLDDVHLVFQKLTLISVIVQNLSIATSPMTLDDGAKISLSDFAELGTSGGANACAVVPAGNTATILVADKSRLGFNALGGDAGGQVNVFGLSESAFTSQFFDTSGGAACTLTYETSCDVGALVPGVTLVAAPTPNFVNLVNAAPIGPGQPIDFAAPAIARRSPGTSGALSLNACVSGTLGALDVVTVALVRDGATTLLSQQVAPFGGTEWCASLTFLDLVADLVPHVYSLHVTTAAASTITVPVDAASFQIVEL